MSTVLYLIVPCFNEEKVLPFSSKLFLEIILKLIKSKKISDKSRILFLDNASTDNTWKIITDLSKTNTHYIGARQSRNFGHQGNVLAGLMESKDKCDVTISIDCDGQDDINAIENMIDEYHKGNEVVYGVRSSRKTDTFLKRFTAQTYYKMLKLMGADIIYNHADYRLISSKVLQEFANFKEVNLFLRGLIPMVGFKSSTVYYERHERIAGKSHYSVGKLFSLAFDGITSLSTKPIRLITIFGLLISFISFIGVIWIVIAKLCNLLTHDIQGWTSIICTVCLVGGIQIAALGIIGEYIGKIYLEVKARPRFIISERTWDNSPQKHKKK